MNETEARTLREAHNAYVRFLDGISRYRLAAELVELETERGIIHLYGGPSTRDELISALCEIRYPAAKLNEAGHVLWHSYGAVNSACKLCHGQGNHDDLNCDCGAVSLHAECACGHPRHKHWRPSGTCAAVELPPCPCPGYRTARS